jgi:anthranilate synthase component 1
MNPDITLNLGLEEYLTAVTDQPKPLIIPLCAELPLPDISPLEVYKSTRTGQGFLLESMEGSEKIARYSYIGIDPEFVITIGQTIEIKGNEPFTAIVKEPDGGTPVDQIKSILSRFCYMNVKAPRFFGGMVGYFAYDCVYSLFDQVREVHPHSTDSTGKRDLGTILPALCSPKTASSSIMPSENSTSFRVRS